MQIQLKCKKCKHLFYAVPKTKCAVHKKCSHCIPEDMPQPEGKDWPKEKAKIKKAKRKAYKKCHI